MRIGTSLTAVAALSFAAASPALAASPDKAASKAPPPAPGNSGPNIGAIMGLFDKMFPPQPEPDPARLALARTSVQSMWPDGAYGKMMSGLMGTMFDRMMQMKASDLGAASGMKTPAMAAANDLSIHDQAAKKDPYFDQRMAAMRQVVTEELGRVSAIIDPRMREGLARAMARRFEAQQLGEINRFIATPTGQAFAGQYMQLWVDPDTIRSIFTSVPELMKLMPEVTQKFKAVEEKFPKPPKTAEPAKPAQITKSGKKATH